MSWIFLLLPFIFFMSCGDLLDEEAPKPPEKLSGYFTLSETFPKVSLKWDKSISDDVSEYHIFRSQSNDFSFDSIAIVKPPVQLYKDTTINWLDSVYYKVRSRDRAGNVGSFSEPLEIFCYKAGGNWEIINFDSSYLCVNPQTNATPEIFRLVLGTPFETLGDTSGIMDFNQVFLDTALWTGGGWMYYTYKVLEAGNDTSGFDTVTYANTIAPEYFTIDLSEPEGGTIIFDSGRYGSIYLEHTVKSCNGDNLFP